MYNASCRTSSKYYNALGHKLFESVFPLLCNEKGLTLKQVAASASVGVIIETKGSREEGLL